MFWLRVFCRIQLTNLQIWVNLFHNCPQDILLLRDIGLHRFSDFSPNWYGWAFSEKVLVQIETIFSPKCN